MWGGRAEWSARFAMLPVMLYEQVVKPLLFRLDAEDAHHLTLRGLRVAGRVPLLPHAAGLMGARHASLELDLLGRRFLNPLGLAAGLDKNADAVPMFGAFGFGFLEVGTVTPRPQPGNPRPRLFRLPSDTALINRMGFNNLGAEVVAARLAARPASPVQVWANIGKNKDTPNENAADDYRACVRALQPSADAFVVNVSSPNTPGLRALQAGEDLRALLGEVLAEVEAQRVRLVRPAPPVLVKIAPDLSPEDHELSVQAAVEAGVQGLVVSNTTLSREGLTHAHRGEAGGLSGLPLQARSTAMVRATRRLTTLPIVGVGGVFTAEDAYEKIRAGANLVEVYTALIYKGPLLVREINMGLARLLARDGFRNVAEAVGTDA